MRLLTSTVTSPPAARTKRSSPPRPASWRLYLRVALFVGAGAIALPALAQYAWLDARGVRQFSDRPPPPSVPDHRILKAPGKPSTVYGGNINYAAGQPHDAAAVAGNTLSANAAVSRSAPANTNAAVAADHTAARGPTNAGDAGDAGASVPGTASMAEREAAYTQRRKDALTAQNKAANEAREQAEQQANCQAARQNQRALDDGLRLSSYDDGGNRTIMDDAGRAALAKKTQKVLAGCK